MKNKKFQGRISEQNKTSLGMSDQKFLDQCLDLHQLGLIKKMYQKLSKAKKDALKNLKVG